MHVNNTRYSLSGSGSAGIIAALLLLLSAIVSEGRVLVRSYGTADGLSHIHVRDIMQDSAGYMWFATWTGVDRFDGYEFRHFRTYPGDSVRLDNNRVERLAQAGDGRILVRTYTGRIYSLDPVSAAFAAATDADSLSFDSLRLARRRNRLRDSLKSRVTQSGLRYVDRQGNLWIVRNGGVDYIAPAPEAFRFIDSEPVDTLGEDIHVVYAAPDGRLWAASRDTRIMLYDADGSYLGNLASDGSIAPDRTAKSGVRAYAFFADSLGRIWVGTKSRQLLLLTPDGSNRFNIDRYRQSQEDGKLLNADIYGFAEDARRRIWLATFGGGVARAIANDDGSLNFEFPKTQPRAVSRARRLLAVDDTVMAVAATQGVAVFNPCEASPRFHAVGTAGTCPLGNEDILDVCKAADGKVYFAAFSGGIDYVDSLTVLRSENPVIHNINCRNGLDAEPVLSVIQTDDSDFWVATLDAVSRYDSTWCLKATYDAGNVGRSIRPTEARPQIMPDGRIVYGLSGGLLFIDPSAIAADTASGFAVTEIGYAGKIQTGLDRDSTLTLPRGVRDMSVRFAALDYACAANVRYAYRFDDAPDWINLGREHTVRISSLPAGIHVLHLRCSDAFGSWRSGELKVRIDVPRTWLEILVGILLLAAAVLLVFAAAFACRRVYVSRRRRRMLERYISCALGAAPVAAGNPVMEEVCAYVASHYSSSSMKTEHIAASIRIGRNELRRVVKNILGMSLEDFIRLVRVRAAARLLRDRDMTVAEVAYACGFSTPQYMAMVFKDVMGCTPSEYSRENGAARE